MKNLVELAVEVQSFLKQNKWKYCVIGGLAVQHWGEPRLTRDVDFTILTGFGGEESYIDILLSRFSARINEAKIFAMTNRVLLLKSKSGIGIDISLAGLPFEQSMIERAVKVELLPNLTLKLCSVEDLIILKAFASRETDWRDVETVVARQQTEVIDWEYVDECLLPLSELKEDPEIMNRLLKIRNS